MPRILFLSPWRGTISNSILTKTDNELTQHDLTELMDFYGSDKGTKHGYTKHYIEILKNKRTTTRSVLEIGIGTHYPDIPSNMGKNGTPGASLRAWRDYFPHAQIFGADIDRRILFNEERIQTFFLDQLDPRTYDDLEASISKPLDLIIVDGLHIPTADILSLIKLFSLLSPFGDLFIEDIGKQSKKFVWPIVLFLLNRNYSATFVARDLLHIRPSKRF